MTKRTFLAIAALAAALAVAPTAGLAQSHDHEHDHGEHGHDHEHGEEGHGDIVELGELSVGGYDVHVMIGWPLTPGGDTHFEVFIGGKKPFPRAVRAWIGDELAEQTGKALLDREGDRGAHGHPLVPKTLDPAYRVWVEVENDRRQKSRGSLPLEVSESGGHDHDHGDDGHGHDDHGHGREPGASTVKASIKALGQGDAGAARYALTLVSDAGEALTASDLKVVHTERVHLLLIDPSLGDYQHIHPVETEPGVWSFQFRPLRAGQYKVFADIAPVATGKQEYAAATIDIGGAVSPPERGVNTRFEDHGWIFDLAFDVPKLVAGEAALLTVEIKNHAGEPAPLAPLMGAYAHIVAFDADREEIAHVHPMGEEPDSPDDRGGPTVEAHVVFSKPGYKRIFAQTLIDGQEIFAPFGVMVEAK